MSLGCIKHSGVAASTANGSSAALRSKPRTHTVTVTVREGENVGPVDWEHETAKDMPPIWREAERRPGDFTFSEYRRQIVSICMYDGWPYWTPRPAICFIGPLNSAVWAFFDSYAVGPHSIERRPK